MNEQNGGQFEYLQPQQRAEGRNLQQEISRELPSLSFMSLKGAQAEIKELQLDPRFAMLSTEQIRQMIVSEEMANRDKFTFVSAAICGPLFLFGLGAAFALFDDIKAAREAKLQKLLTGQDSGKGKAGAALVRAETLEETKKKQESIIAVSKEKPVPNPSSLTDRTGKLTPEAQKLLGLESNRRLKLEAAGSSHSRRDISGRVKEKLYTGGERTWEEKAAERSLKSWLKAEILLKRKQSLLDNMERVRGQAPGDFGLYAGLAARVENLDKQLKRMGYI
ncbi:MAG: hypothetical protein K2Y32_22380 [Candidatus Obscuribacterales bacterium]|nr:hypothetical protein [Candidatus Obscuribacterales bacterium]